MHGQLHAQASVQAAARVGVEDVASNRRFLHCPVLTLAAWGRRITSAQSDAKSIVASALACEALNASSTHSFPRVRRSAPTGNTTEKSSAQTTSDLLDDFLIEESSERLPTTKSFNKPPK